MEKLIRIGEAARLLGVSDETLRNWERKGLIAPYRVGPRKERRYEEAYILRLRKGEKCQ